MKKRGFSIVAGPLLYWILGILGLAVFAVLVYVLKGKGQGALEFIKNIWSFAR